MATSEGPRSAAIVVEPQQVDDSQEAVVEIPDEDVPPPGWDQWVNLPAPALDGGSRGEG
jgi:hypothetical protein